MVGGSDGKCAGKDVDDVDEVLDVIPLQDIHIYGHDKQTQTTQKPLEVQFQRSGKITELLQVN